MKASDTANSGIKMGYQRPELGARGEVTLPVKKCSLRSEIRVSEGGGGEHRRTSP